MLKDNPNSSIIERNYPECMTHLLGKKRKSTFIQLNIGKGNIDSYDQGIDIIMGLLQNVYLRSKERKKYDRSTD